MEASNTDQVQKESKMKSVYAVRISDSKEIEIYGNDHEIIECGGLLTISDERIEFLNEKFCGSDFFIRVGDLMYKRTHSRNLNEWIKIK